MTTARARLREAIEAWHTCGDWNQAQHMADAAKALLKQLDSEKGAAGLVGSAHGQIERDGDTRLSAALPTLTAAQLRQISDAIGLEITHPGYTITGWDLIKVFSQAAARMEREGCRHD